MLRAEIERFLEPLDGELTPVREFALKYFDSTMKFDEKSGALLLKHAPEVAPEAYGLVMFPGLSVAQIDRYCELHRALDIPSGYRSVLTRINGAAIFGSILFGAPLSMINDPPSLDRSQRQPMDLATANHDWRDPGIDPELFLLDRALGPTTKMLNTIFRQMAPSACLSQAKE